MWPVGTKYRLRTAPRRPKLFLEALEDRRLPSTFVLDALTDTGEGSSLSGDLRYALTQARSGDTILFAVSGTFGLASLLPVLKENLTIEGPGPDWLTVERVSGGDAACDRMKRPSAGARRPAARTMPGRGARCLAA